MDVVLFDEWSHFLDSLNLVTSQRECDKNCILTCDHHNYSSKLTLSKPSRKSSIIGLRKLQDVNKDIVSTFVNIHICNDSVEELVQGYNCVQIVHDILAIYQRNEKSRETYAQN